MRKIRYYLLALLILASSLSIPCHAQPIDPKDKRKFYGGASCKPQFAVVDERPPIVDPRNTASTANKSDKEKKDKTAVVPKGKVKPSKVPAKRAKSAKK